MTRKRFYSARLSAVFLCLLPLLSTAVADSVADENTRLKKKLREAEAEIERLRHENSTLRGTSSGASESKSGPAPIARPELRESKLAPPATNEVIAAQALIDQYRLDPLGAESNFKGKRFRVRGTVERIEPPHIGLAYIVFLRGADGLVLIECATRSPGITAVSLSKDGRTLFGEPFFKPVVALATLGRELTVEGICSGVRDGRLHFEKCRPVP